MSEEDNDSIALFTWMSDKDEDGWIFTQKGRKSCYQLG